MKSHLSSRIPSAIGVALLAGIATQPAIAQPPPARILSETTTTPPQTLRNAVRQALSETRTTRTEVGPTGAPSVQYSENFDSVCAAGSPTQPYAPPAGFTVHNVDGRTPAANVAYVTSAWVVREDFIVGPTTNCAMFSTSWYSPAGAADDWAVLPVQVTPTANTKLSWEGFAPDAAYPDGYEVRYSTTGTNPADFLANAPLLTVPAESAAWTPRSISLGTQAGTPIHIAFRNNSNDKFLLLIDDIEVAEVLTHDPALLALSQSPHGGYSRLPAFLGYPFDLAAEINNNGTDPLTSVVVDADVLRDGAPESVFASTPVALGSGATQSVSLGSSAYLSPGAWTVEATVQAAEGDNDAANSSASIPLAEVTTSELARWEGAFTGALGIGAASGGELGVVFDVPAEALLVSMQYAMNNPDGLPDPTPDPGDEGDGIADFNGYTLQMTLREWDAGAGTPGALIHTAETTVAVDAPIGPMTLEFPTGRLVLPAGRYVASAVEPTTPEPRTLAVFQSDERFEPSTVWVSWPATPWTPVEAFGAQFAKTFAVSVFLEPVVAVPVAVDDAFSVGPGGTLAGSVADNDTPSDNGGNVWILNQDATTGSLQFEPDGSFSYQAATGGGGTTDTFAYQLCDAEDDCAGATVTVTVLPEAIFADSFE